MRHRRIGVLGGTFDPIHIGHLALAEAADEALALEQVLFVPAGSPPHKQGRRITSPHHRQRMTELAIAGNEHFALSTVDLTRSGPSYTVDTLRLLAAKYEGAELFFIIGGDSLLDLPTWYHPEEILQLAYLAAAERPGFSLEDVAAKLGGLYQQFGHRICLFHAPLLDISSSMLRERLRSGRSVRYLVPDAVLDYIKQNNLYQDT